MSETTRRAVLAGAIGAGAAAVVTACGGGGSDSGSNSGSGSGSGSQAQDPTQNPPTTSAATANGLAKTSEIPVGGGKIFDTQQVVVTQPSAGQFKAFSAICTHMGCTVGSVSGGLIKCPCHGSQYSIQDGSVKGGPAPKALPAKQVTVTGDEITVS